MKRFLSALLVMIITASTLFAFAGCNKEPEKTYEGIRFIFEELAVDDKALETYSSDPARYRDIISDDFALGKDGADHFYENFAEYYVYGMTIKVLNYTESELTLTSLESDSNGKDGVYIRKSINGSEIGIGAKLANSDFLADALTLQILNSNIELSDSDVIEIVKSMNLTLTCTDGTEEKKVNLSIEDSAEITEPATNDGSSVAAFNLYGYAFVGIDGIPFTKASELEATYGMTSKEAEKIVKKIDSCHAYSYTLSIENLCDKDVVVYDVSLEKNGKNDLYAKGTLGSELGLAARDPSKETGMPPFIVNILCTDDDMIESDVMDTLDTMKFVITYAEKTVSGDEMNDEVGEKKTVAVSIL